MKFSLVELARILHLWAVGKRVEALTAFEKFHRVPAGLLTILKTYPNLEAEVCKSKLWAARIESSYGDGWVCYEREAMKQVRKPGRLPVIPLLELRDLLREVWQT